MALKTIIKLHKYFTLLILTCIAILIIYVIAFSINKHFQKQKINDFYSKEAQISKSLSNYPTPLIKNIPENKPVRILVLEGGGIRGIISSQLLDFLEKSSGQPISDLFDIITGTSIGALQSVVLTIPDENNRPKYSAENLLSILIDQSPNILNATKMDWILSGFSLLLPLINTYSYIDMLKRYMGNTQLSQLTTNVILTGYSIPQRKILFLNSRRTKNDNTPNFLAYQAIAGVTAIPGLMPPQKITALSKNHESYVIADPARIINNPLIEAFLYAEKLYPKNKKIVVFLGMGLDEKNKKVEMTDYYYGLLGGINEYYEMGVSNDKLFKYFFTELSSLNAPGEAKTELFYIDDIIQTPVANTVDISKENISALQAEGNLIIKETTTKSTKFD